MIDLHFHALPGIDDGPRTMTDALALAQAAAAAGTKMIVATPHVSWEHPNSAEAIHDSVAGLNDALVREGIELRVLPGAEVSLGWAVEQTPAELDGLCLGGGPWLLVEPPFAPASPGLETLFGTLAMGGRQLVVAHPERCPAFHRDISTLERLTAAGALTSLTASSFNGRFGRPVQKFSRSLLSRGLVHNVASDAHDLRGRGPELAGEMTAAGLEWLASWAAEAVPRAIIAGEDIPPQPFGSPSEPNGRWWKRLLR